LTQKQVVNGSPDARRRRSRRWVYLDQGNADAQYHVPLLGKVGHALDFALRPKPHRKIDVCGSQVCDTHYSNAADFEKTGQSFGRLRFEMVFYADESHLVIGDELCGERVVPDSKPCRVDQPQGEIGLARSWVAKKQDPFPAHTNAGCMDNNLGRFTWHQSSLREKYCDRVSRCHL
jgi:hypothetical protein